MVTFAQAQERAERWVNGDVPASLHREVRVREFDLGFVAWAEDREGGPSTGSASGEQEESRGGAQRSGGRARLVIARDSGETTLWPGLPVGEVIRRYEEEYGAVADGGYGAAEPAPQRIDLEATSFLLTPPEWLQQAADARGIPDGRGGAGSGAAPSAPSVPAQAGPPAAAAAAGPAPAAPPAPATPSVPSAAVPSASDAWAEVSVNGAGDGVSQDGADAAETGPVPGVPGGSGASGTPAEATPWAAADTTSSDGGGEDLSVGLPQTVFAPPLAGFDEEDAPAAPRARPEAKTELLRGGSQLPRTQVAPAVELPDGTGPGGGPAGGPGGAPLPPPMPAAPPAVPGLPDLPPPSGPPVADVPPPPGVAGAGAPGVPGPGTPPAPPAGGGVHAAATMLADGSSLPGNAAGGPPPPPGVPGAGRAGGPQDAAKLAEAETGKAGVRPPGGPAASGAPAGGYVPTQLVSQLDGADLDLSAVDGPGGADRPGGTGGPGAGGPGGPGGGVHAAATMLAGGAALPGGPGAGGPAGPGMPPATPPAGPHVPPPGVPGPTGGPGGPGAYGYPQAPSGQPTVGPGYMAVLSYRAPDGSEQKIVRRSAPGTPHPEWQLLHELRGMNVPPQQVLELHTELECCDLPGGYCARMIRDNWPQVRISHTAAYGRDHASRQQGVRHLVEHQGELHQVADGPARPAPVRVPLPHPSQVPPAPPVPPQVIGQELEQAFGPQGIFRFDQRAVSRHGVPDVVAQMLVWAGLPVDFGPFFWAQAQPHRPVPTLAELALERGVQPAPDAGSYLVMGNDFGRQLCVQYGTANIVAVPMEAHGGQSAAPQFVNSGLPEFVRCLAMLGRMWRLRYGLTPEQAGRWTVDFQAQLVALDPPALGSPETWWSVLLEQMWDGLL
ncbi:SUKH-4 family immunity protein [Streptomyces lydicus]|uniref:SUKH-4 family immunity protein n=1 Tax=Streptomyces lydicus TaxID=47763 RepID=UPI0033DEFAA5